MQVTQTQPGMNPEGPLAQAESSALSQPAYLARLATLPERNEVASSQDSTHAPFRPDSRRLDQIEHALTILASVVARLGKEAQQTRLQLRSTEHDPSLAEERRSQRELVRSMQARLNYLEERLDRGLPAALPAAGVSSEVTEQLSASLNSIRHSLAALATRRKRGVPSQE
jgi:hypothetical protein